MNYVSKAGVASLIAIFGLTAVGCDGDDGQDGATTRVVDLAPGPVCANGGVEFRVGFDSNRDGELSDEEITETKVVCNGEDGQDGTDGANGTSSLVNLTAEPAGGNCEAGGYRVDSGLDNGDGGGTAGNSLLEAGEVDATNYVCHGVDGFTVLTTLTAAAPANCPDGGQRLDIGLDNGDNSGISRDGTLQAGEIDSTGYICNGANGQDGTDGTNGSDGQTTLVKQDTPSITDCPYGGVTVTSGLDNGDGGGTANNAVLESGEVDYTHHVCNGDQGGGGTELVDSNGVVLGSVLGATPTEITLRTPDPYNYLVSIGWDGSFLDKFTIYSAAGCTGDARIYIDGTPNQSIPAKSAFWAGKEGQFMVPIGTDSIANQVLNYESFWEAGACTDSTGSEDLWAATLMSDTSIGLPATITPPLSLQ
ncbi:DUF7151 family protein [Marinobacter zhejiangensis]|uniref:DUF7151 domain-containing protein n=1 Tax=Marinobacter zhejiangensis TaxID=488535 RepID=A0A1I4T239_9GAMM|nr:hypothetical protein [Marinobacter zhejiangensis]SFM70828.1 hypothetical protein SAMN04487963_3453 [Marinobacter zhejiangensis]